MRRFFCAFMSCLVILKFRNTYIKTNNHVKSYEFLKVYPNPYSLNWHCSDTVVFYTIHDLLGLELKSKKLSEQSGTILIDELSPGSYILSMQTASRQRLQQHILRSRT